MSRRRYCFAPGCNTGYSHISNNKNVSLFSVPKNKLDQWKAVTPHPAHKDLKKNDALCEKHFRKHDIVREVVTATYRYPLKTPRLRPNAKPSIWPNCPSHLLTALGLPEEEQPPDESSEESFEEPVTKWTRILDEDAPPHLYKMDTEPAGTNHVCVEPSTLIVCNEINPTSIDDEVVTDIKAEDDDPLQSWLHNLFNRLSKTNVTLPSESWTVKCYNNIIAVFETAPIEDDIAITKKIVVSKSSVNFFIFQHLHEQLTEESDKQFSSLADFEVAVVEFDQLTICYGLKMHGDHLTMDFKRLTRRYYQDEFSKGVRHKNCQYIRGAVPGKCSFKYVKCCDLCRNAKKALRYLKQSMEKTETRMTVFRKNVIKRRKSERRLQLRLERVMKKLQEVTATTTTTNESFDPLAVDDVVDEDMSDDQLDVKEEFLNVDKQELL